jgi:hypothetical protein
MIILYAVGIFEIPVPLLFAVVDALTIIGIILAKAFLKNSIALRPGPIVLSVVAYILAIAMCIYSSSNGEAWVPFVLGGFFTMIAVAAMVVGMRIHKASAIDGSNL